MKIEIRGARLHNLKDVQTICTKLMPEGVVGVAPSVSCNWEAQPASGTLTRRRAMRIARMGRKLAGLHLKSVGRSLELQRRGQISVIASTMIAVPKEAASTMRGSILMEVSSSASK